MLRSRLASGKQELHRPAQDTDSDETWRLVKSWLHTCLNTHGECATKLISSGGLPTRLVDVGLDDTAVRLCQGDSLPRDTRYLTLSHCWGSVAFTTLTRSNLHKFKRRIPTQKLTKTFQDAIVTTRRLGFRYLWIDSLCIIQRNVVDWQRELTKMESVYTNSTLNICASDSADGEAGCFFQRDATRLYGCRVQACFDPDDSTRTCSLDCFPLDYAKKRLESNVLESRAWVFQEKILAPRAILMGASEVVWECREVAASETCWSSFEPPRRTRASVITSWTARPPQSVSELWCDCVLAYSRGQLTFPRDRLAAISAVARQFAARFNTTYVGGLWEEDLLHQLLWYSVLGDQRLRPSEYRAPSWSWASVDGQIDWQRSLSGNDGELQILSDIVSVTVQHAGDPFGGLTDGRLVVRSRALSCCFIRAGGLSMSDVSVPLTGYGKVSKRFHPDAEIGDDDDNPHYFLLPLMACEERDRARRVFGLALKPVGGVDGYQRVGMWDFVWEKQDNVKSEYGPCMERHPLGRRVGVDDEAEPIYEYTIL